MRIPKNMALAAILALVFYPVLFNLPLNLVRFRWGFRHGVAPMPPDVEERAIAADTIARLFYYAVLLTFIVVLLRNWPIPATALGFTSHNWKAAAALGICTGVVVFGILSFFLRDSSEHTQKDMESHGSFVMWCGIHALGSFSGELWRVFCIVALMRLGFSGWTAVSITAAAFGITQATANMARAAGAAAFGAIAGILFIKTGSFFAPLIFSSGVAIAYNYYIRRVVQLRSAGVSRFEVTCPACKAVFDSRQREKGKAFACPHCGEKLMYQSGQLDWLCVEFSLFVPPVLFYLLGLRGMELVLAAALGIVVSFFLTLAIYSRLSPPELVGKSSELHLGRWRRDRE